VPLGPAEIHPEQHLRPIGGLGAACTRADHEQRAPLVVLAGEEEGGALAGELAVEIVRIAVQLGGELGVVTLGQELDEREEILGATLEVAPGRDLGSEAVGLPEDPLGAPLVVPKPWFAGLRL
jgi:hypothetical protein